MLHHDLDLWKISRIDGMNRLATEWLKSNEALMIRTRRGSKPDHEGIKY